MTQQIRSHRDLVAWQKSFELGLRLYDAVERFPSHERFALADQIRRGAYGVPSDISEGYGRGSTGDYLRFLRMARGSLYELDTQLLFARHLNYLSAAPHIDLEGSLNECGRLIAGLIRSIESAPPR